MNRCQQISLVNSAAGLLLLVSGCLPHYKVRVTDTGAPKYEKVAIAYLIEGSRGGLVPEKTGSVEQVAITSETTAGSGADWSITSLQIEYPHPQVDAGMARATLRLSRGAVFPESKTIAQRFHSSLDWLASRDSESNAQPQPNDELWVLDFPRQQLDLLLVDLANSGFFEDQQRPEGGTQLSVTIDRGQTAKPWSTDARLNGIVQRVQREGWLVGFASPNENPIGSGVERVAKSE